VNTRYAPLSDHICLQTAKLRQTPPLKR
jgi:hypothetical protein